MDTIIGYLGFVFRLTFLPLKKHIISKKWKITLMLSSNIIMVYAVFIISIQPQRGIFRQVEDAYGTEQSVLDKQLRRLNDIIFKNARRQNPNMITIIPTAELEAQRKQDSINAANALSLDDQLFLLDVASGKK